MIAMITALHAPEMQLASLVRRLPPFAVRHPQDLSLSLQKQDALSKSAI
jgi:hypothetical protein